MNNLFDFATSELSQDAFICWLINWYNYKDKNIELYNIAKEFLRKCVDGKINIDKIQTVKVERQVKKIDVLITIDEDFYIIIEDKTYTFEHNSQISTYKNTIMHDKSVEANQVVTVYYKIIDEFDRNRNADIVLTRKDILEMMRPYVKNDIYLNYKEHLIAIDEKVNRWQVTPMSEWDGYCYQGFFKYEEKRIDTTWWGYVNNKTGGFWCFREELLNNNPSIKDLQNKLSNNIDEFYIQTECIVQYNKELARNQNVNMLEIKIVFKDQNDISINAIMWSLFSKLKEHLKNSNNIELQKKAFRKGEHMTVGYIFFDETNFEQKVAIIQQAVTDIVAKL